MYFLPSVLPFLSQCARVKIADRMAHYIMHLMLMDIANDMMWQHWISISYEGESTIKLRAPRIILCVCAHVEWRYLQGVPVSNGSMSMFYNLFYTFYCSLNVSRDLNFHLRSAFNVQILCVDVSCVQSFGSLNINRNININWVLKTPYFIRNTSNLIGSVFFGICCLFSIPFKFIRRFIKQKLETHA